MKKQMIFMFTVVANPQPQTTYKIALSISEDNVVSGTWRRFINGVPDGEQVGIDFTNQYDYVAAQIKTSIQPILDNVFYNLG